MSLQSISLENARLYIYIIKAYRIRYAPLVASSFKHKQEQNPHLIRDTLGVSHGFGKRDVIFRGVDTQVSGNTVDSHPLRHHVGLQVKGST